MPGGSGLLSFFKSFLPGCQNFDYDRSLDALTPDETQQQEQDENDGSNSVEVEFEPQTFQEWRKYQKEVISHYIQQRLLNENDDDNDDCMDYGSATEEEDEEEDGNSDMSDEEEEKTNFETQEGIIMRQASEEERLDTQEEQVTSRQSGKHGDKKRIPHVHKALHSVSDMNMVDLKTSDFSLDFARIIRIWRKRETRRGQQSNISQVVPVFPGRVPRNPYPGMEEDGPMATAYDTVLSMEIELVDKPDRDTNLKSRMMIFLYNEYADAFQIWVERIEKYNLIIRLSKIPAQCIFPFALDPREWLDQQEMMKYCLCIGGKSRLYNNAGNRDENEEKSYIRMDVNLEIRVAHVGGAAKSNHPELILSQRQSQHESSFEVENNALQMEWRNSRGLTIPDDTAQTAPERANDEPNRRLDHKFLNAQDGRHQREIVHAVPSNGQRDREAQVTANPRREAEAPTTTTRTQQGGVSLPTRIPNPFAPRGNRIPRSENDQGRYTYTKLSQFEGLKGNNRFDNGGIQPVNVYAIVLLFSQHNRSKRGDWYMEVSLIDKTFFAKPMTLIIFVKDPSQFPRIRRVGDILRMHRVVIEVWEGNVQLQSPATKKGTRGSFVVMGRDQGGAWYRESTGETCTFTTEDGNRSHTLWDWGQDYIRNTSTIIEKHRTTLADVANIDIDDPEQAKKQDRDFTIMVTGIYPIPAEFRTNRTPYGYVRVWDGTGNSPSDPSTLGIHPAASKRDPSTEAVIKVATLVHRLQRLDPKLDLETPLSLCGRVANAFVWEKSHWDVVHGSLKVGSFVRMRNVKIQVFDIPPYSSLKGLSIHPKTWLSPLPDLNYDVKRLLIEHAARMSRNEYNLESGLLPGNWGSGIRARQSRHKDLGDGLLEFVSQDGGKRKFVGVVQILSTNPKVDGLKSVVVADKSTTTEVLVLKAPAKKLLEMMNGSNSVAKRNANNFIDSRIGWKATLKRVETEGKKFYVLRDIQKV